MNNITIKKTYVRRFLRISKLRNELMLIAGDL